MNRTRIAGALLTTVGLLLSATHAAAAPLCASPAPVPGVRKEGVLTVTSPAHEDRAGGHRLRTHTKLEGRIIDKNIVWHGPEVPAFVPLIVGSMNLDLLDRVPGGYMALYRAHDLDQPPMNASCGIDAVDNGKELFPGAKKNCASEVRLYDCAGQLTASLPMAQFLSRPDHLEVQDARYEDGTLYFNEACQGYARNAGGRCSSLVAVAVDTRKVLWRTASLVSNNAFALTGDYIVTAYGFTAERSAIRIVRKKDGVVMDTKPLGSAADDDLTVRGDVVSVNLYNMLGRVTFRVDGRDSGAPKLVPLAPPRPQPTPPLAPSPTPPRRAPEVPF